MNVLTVENNATDRTNLMRDVEENKEQMKKSLIILSKSRRTEGNN